jgi:hypothetical protein
MHSSIEAAFTEHMGHQTWLSSHKNRVESKHLYGSKKIYVKEITNIDRITSIPSDLDKKISKFFNLQ